MKISKKIIIPIITLIIVSLMMIFVFIIYQKKQLIKKNKAQNQIQQKVLTAQEQRQERRRLKKEKQESKKQERLEQKEALIQKKIEIKEAKKVETLVKIQEEETPVESSPYKIKCNNNNNLLDQAQPVANTINFTDPNKSHPQFNETFDDKFKTNILFNVDAYNFLVGGSNIALLNSSQNFDTYLYTQSIVDLSLELQTPQEQYWRDINFKFTGRMNAVLGNVGEVTTTSEEFIKIGRSITETLHSHTIDRPLLWAREAWLQVFSQSGKSSVQAGIFPKKIGLGLVLGNNYKNGDITLTNPTEQTIDQFRPGIEFRSMLMDNKLRATGYCGMNVMTSTSFDNQAAYTNGQELQNNAAPYTREKPSTGKLKNNFLLSLEFDLLLGDQKEYDDKHTELKTYVMLHKDNLQQVEFAGDATSSLFTTGACVDFKRSNLECNFEFGINFGSQNVKSWDRNVVEEHARLTQTHLFVRTYNLMDNPNSSISDSIDSSGDWELSPAFPWPSEDDSALQYDSGAEFQDANPTMVNNEFLMPANSGGSAVDLNHTFKNSYSRYRKSYTNSYRGWMCALDLSYKFKETFKVGFIGGVASGDENPNDSPEKSFLYRLDSNWDSIRQDSSNHNYGGFIGTQSLYSSKSVPSFYMLTAQKLNNSINMSKDLTSPDFSNLCYCGLGLHFEKENMNTSWIFNPNLLLFTMPHQIKFGYDPTVHDIFTTYLLQSGSANYDRFINSYDKTLSGSLGIEFNANVNFLAGEALNFYASAGIFIPGGHYDDIQSYSYNNKGKHIPLKNQLSVSKYDVTGVENTDQYMITVLNNASWIVKVGLEFNFDAQTTLFHERKRKKRSL